MRKDAEMHDQPLNGINFYFVQFKEKSTAVFMLQLETAAAAAVPKVASVEKPPKPHSTRLGLLWPHQLISNCFLGGRGKDLKIKIKTAI